MGLNMTQEVSEHVKFACSSREMNLGLGIVNIGMAFLFYGFQRCTIKFTDMSSVKSPDRSFWAHQTFVWGRRCLIKFCDGLKLFGQCEHLKGFSSVWVLRYLD